MQTSRQLTEFFVPDHYDLSLKIDRQNRLFSGVVEVDGTKLTDASVWLHAKDLTITECLVDAEPAEFVPGENDELEIKLSSASGSRHHLKLTFSGSISDQMHGMYPCYFDVDGVKKELIATQFESHHAREVFPCVDEPSAKATFDVTLTTEGDVTVLGNMPVKQQQTEAGILVTTFETTPKMSSYLLAWVVGELHSVTAKTASGVDVSIWATPAQSAASLTFALDIATRTIDFFDEYFGIPYPLPKCDHVALPDFSSGAMENWGLITYREVALLAEPGSVSLSSKHRIAAVIAHELSHQWFGNLVTMKWWNNLWLNESFANLMEYIAIDAIEPSWNVWFDFAGYETVISLRRDATDGVQPVQVDVSHPDEISTLFDPAIVYAKGSRLLHMLESYIGREAFRNGLRDYFEKHAYQNTAETDLWDALSTSSGQDVAGLMTPWISQPGYPVVVVNKDELRQEQFFIGEHKDAGRIWPIPLGDADTAMPQLLDTASVKMTVSPKTWLNRDDSAHFITHYSDDLLASHLAAVRTGGIDPIGRLQLLHEQTLLARGGRIKSAQLLPLLDVYRNESTESVWDIMAVAVGELKKFVETDEAAEQSLRRFSKELATSQFERLGWIAKSGESESDTKLRATIIGMMLYGEDPAALEHAAELAHGQIESIDPELRSLVLGSAIRYADSDTLFKELLSRYESTPSAELQQDIASALTSTKQADQIDQLISMLQQPKVVRSQDVARWFVYLIRNRYAREKTWAWMRNNWQWIESTFGGDKSYDDYPRYAATGLVTRQQLQEYKDFFEPLKSQISLTRVIEMGISEIEARVSIIETDGPEVRAALLKQK